LKPDLRTELREKLTGRLCIVGVGNIDRGDDGFGVRLAEALLESGVGEVVVAGTTPENWVERIGAGNFEQVLFLDVVQIGAEPGSAVFLNAAEIETRYPQVSTHKLSLGLLARLIAARGAKVWLLGVQPQSLRMTPAVSPPCEGGENRALSEPVRQSLDVLKDVLVEVCGTDNDQITSTKAQTRTKPQTAETTAR
jgi:hydrogenase 3 maturation protease